MAGALTLGLAACGSSSSGTASSTAAADSAASGAAVSEASSEASSAASGTADTGSIDLSGSDAASDGVLTVGTNATFPPFEYIGDDGEPTGFDMALIKEIGSRLGLEVEIQDMDFDALTASIGTKIDAAIAGMTVTDERKEAVDFSDPYYDATQAVLLPADSTISTRDDLTNAQIGVQLGTTGNTVVDEIHGEGSDLTTAYASYNDVVQDLLNGRTDAVVMDEIPAEAYQSANADKLKVVSGKDFGFDTEQYAIALPKGDTVLVDAVNETLSAMKEDGSFDKMVDEYINNYQAES